jgi:hypothetical protein
MQIILSQHSQANSRDNTVLGCLHYFASKIILERNGVVARKDCIAHEQQVLWLVVAVRAVTGQPWPSSAAGKQVGQQHTAAGRVKANQMEAVKLQ